ncbi:MAG TPA: ATP-binding protein [Terriglobia bacterium]|nr:ATP-binding protein [Terriglobia bacterium]
MNPPRNRKTAIIVLSVIVVVLFAFSVIQQAFNLTPYLGAPERQITLLLWALTSLNVILLTIFSLILMRNLLKLYFERRSQQPGSRFRTKLVFSFLGLSLIPVIFMSFFAYFLLHRNLDKWFSFPIDHLLESVNQVAEKVQPDSIMDAYQAAKFLANHPELKDVLITRSRKGFHDLQEFTKEFDISLALVLEDSDKPLFLLTANGVYFPQEAEFRKITEDYGLVDWKSGEPRLLDADLQNLLKSYSSGPSGVIRRDRSGGEIIFAVGRTRAETLEPQATVIVGHRPPIEIVKLVDQISKSRQYYSSWSTERKAIRYNYLLWLALITLLILFAAVWIGLHMSRRITIPIQALAEAANEVSRGNLTMQVHCPADDELGILISSFNRMTSQLYESSRSLEQTNRDLQNSNLALEERRRYMEAVLENIPTGVISVSSDLSVSTMNKAALEMLGLSQATSPTNIDEILGPAIASEVRGLISKAGRVGIAGKDMPLRVRGRKFYASVTISSLAVSHSQSPGFVMVLEDLTEVLKSQRANAWREVARRMAHEIKNPLTPIQLSAERLLKNFTQTHESDPLLVEQGRRNFEQVLHECVQTIVMEVATLKSMVDEFSRFARMPSATFTSSNLNAIIENTLSSYNGRFQDVNVVKNLAPDVPEIKLDPEQFKRVFVNLFDNALEAMEHSTQKELTISSRFYPQRETVEVVVIDTGHGISSTDKDKLFLPYFSTRKRGTGLGLAIVNRIIADHKGYIHVEDNQPCGSRFVIEIPTG